MTKYEEEELQKGEEVCIDRCVAKYLVDMHKRIGKKLTKTEMKDSNEEMQKQENARATATSRIKLVCFFVYSYH